MKYKKIIVLIILIFPIIGLHSKSGFDDLAWMKLESTSEVSSLRSVKSTKDIIQRDQNLESIPLQDDDYQPSFQVSAVTASPISVACVLAPGGLGDKGYNDMTYLGLEKAQADGLCTFIYAEPTTAEEGNTSLYSFADTYSYDLIIAVSFIYQNYVNGTAKDYPNQAILNIDSAVSEGNLSSTLFKHHEGSFLAGALAGLMTNTGRIGFIGGMDIALIREFWAGYSAGAFYERNNSYIEVFEDYVGYWDRPDIAKGQADEMWRKGVDIIFAAAGASGNGVLQYADETPGVYAIGVDADQDWMYPGDILTSMMKRTDIAVYRAIQDVYNANWIPDIKHLGLAEDGVGLSPMTYTKDLIGEEIIEEVNVTVRNKIIGGALTVPNDTIRLSQWMTSMNIVNKSYSYQPAITIASDTDFGPLKYDFPGTGSISDPYRIKGYFINVSSGSPISISSTTKHFYITDCLLHGLTSSSHGIHLANVYNGTVINNTVFANGFDGIWLESSHDNFILNNTVYGNKWTGIKLGWSSTHNIIDRNTVFNNSEFGIWLGEGGPTNDNIISQNTVFENNWGGIQLDYSSRNIINDNVANKNIGTGINFVSSNDSQIQSNTAFENSASGIAIEKSKNNTIKYNEVYHNGWMGITTSHSKNHTISHNVAKENGADGLSFYFSTDIQVINHTAIENGYNGVRLESLANNTSIINCKIIGNSENGVWLGGGGSNSNLISGNQVLNNSANGIVLGESYYNFISQNTIYGNGYDGISLSNSDFNTIWNNSVSGNNDGIWVIEFSESNNISKNRVFNNRYNGIFTSSDYNTISGNIVYLNNIESGNGITIQPSSYCNISNNLVYQNKGNGIGIEGNHHKIFNNTIYNNINDGIFISNAQYNDFSLNQIYGNNEIGFRLYDSADSNIFSSNMVNTSGASGISLVNSINNTFLTNTIHENGHSGIFLEVSASFNMFENNVIFRNKEVGINVMGGQENIFLSNTIYDHLGYGLVIGSGCSGHLVNENDFIWNNPGGDSQANDEGVNDFDGNFWDEWTGPDANNDGIVDTKYTLAGGAFNFDHTPLTQPRNPSRLSTFHIVSRFTITNPTAGETVDGTITIRWTVPIHSLGYKLTYKISYSTDGGKSWEQLVAGLTTNSYIWDTTTVADGTGYVLRVEAADSEGFVTTVQSQTFTIDNIPSSEPETTTQTTTTEFTSAITPGFSGVVITLIFVGLSIIKYWKRHKES